MSEIIVAGEKIAFNRALCRGEDGRAYHLRDGRPVLGVALADAEPGQPVRYCDDHDAILLALQFDAADRA